MRLPVGAFSSTNHSAGEVLTCEVSPSSDLRRTALLLAARLAARPEVGSMPCWSKAAVRTAIPAATASKLRKHCLSLCIGLAGFASGDDCWRGGERDFAIGLTAAGQPGRFLRLPFPLHKPQKIRVRCSGFLVGRTAVQISSLAKFSDSKALSHPIVLHEVQIAATQTPSFRGFHRSHRTLLAHRRACIFRHIPLRTAHCLNSVLPTTASTAPETPNLT